MQDVMAVLERIATALERIADHSELLTTELPTDAETGPTPCSHPPEQRMPLGGTNGWICQQCQHQQSPS